ncbi:MAG: glycosyltransferase family 2 protein [Cytophagales bacterium]|nr:glycosyltransferase family 2 protein [Cytophagales bacterium]
MISVVCPVLNEEKYIGSLLDFFVGIEPVEKEIWIADGGSVDGTRDVLNNYASKYSTIHWIKNDHKYVPFALNNLIQRCSGEIIVRWDAHTTYAPDYLTAVLATFAKTNADIVGGPMRAIGNNSFQAAVAYATSTPFGVGNSNFHFENFEGLTDSVYLGAWRRQVFEKVGYFDEQMLRNQDDEFHYRAKEAGLKIYQDPKICSWYYPRDSLRNLMSQYYQYGLFKPLVIRKNRSEWKLRHLVPSLFITYLLFIPVAMLVHFVAIVPLIFYLLLVFVFSAKAPNVKPKLWCTVIFPALHLSYGAGFILGLFRGSK